MKPPIEYRPSRAALRLPAQGTKGKVNAAPSLPAKAAVVEPKIGGKAVKGAKSGGEKTVPPASAGDLHSEPKGQMVTVRDRQKYNAYQREYQRAYRQRKKLEVPRD